MAFHRGPDGLCVHAGLDPGVEHIEHQSDQALIWGVSGFPENYAGAEVVAYGHRNNAVLDAEGWPRPRLVGTTIGLDTISHGVLTAVRLNDRCVFQSGRHTMP